MRDGHIPRDAASIKGAILLDDTTDAMSNHPSLSLRSFNEKPRRVTIMRQSFKTFSLESLICSRSDKNVPERRLGGCENLFHLVLNGVLYTLNAEIEGDNLIVD
jgi:hypothetical protein